MVSDLGYRDTPGLLALFCEPNIINKDVRIEFQARKCYTWQPKPRKPASGRLRMRSPRKYSTIFEFDGKLGYNRLTPIPNEKKK